MITGYGGNDAGYPRENTPENVQVIIDEATRLSNLVTDLLDLSKLQSGDAEPDFDEFDLTQAWSILKRYAVLTSQDGYEGGLCMQQGSLCQAD